MSGDGNALPPGWVRVPIREVCGLINGRAFKPTDWSASGMRIIRIQNLNNTHATFNLFDGAVEAKFLVHDGDLLFAWSGTPGTSFGAHIWTRGPAILNQHIFRIEHHSELDRAFLRIAINERLDELIGVAHGGAGLAHVTKPVFEATEILIAPLPEQRRIVAKLDELRARSRKAREALDEVPALLDKLKQSVLAAAFRGDLTAEWRAAQPPGSVEPASVLLDRIRAERRKRWEQANPKKKYLEPEPVDAEGLPELPEGWETSLLEDLVDPVRSITYGIVLTGDPTPDGVPTVRCGDVKGFRVRVESLKRVRREVEEQFRRTRLEGGEVLVAIRGTVGATAVAGPDLAGCNVSREVAVAPVLRPIVSEFVALWLFSPAGAALLSGQVKGVAQSGINIADLKRICVPVPPVEEQERVVREVLATLTKLEALVTKHVVMGAQLHALDQSVLAKAFRGELVPQDPNDEPAEKLLTRINAVAGGAAAKMAGRGRKAKGASP